MQKDNLGAIYERLLSRNNGTGYSFRSNLTSEEKGTTFRIGEESPKTAGGQNLQISKLKIKNLQK